MPPIECPITDLRASAYRIPTDLPEADGIIAWDSTTLILVEVSAGGKAGLGYTYADPSTALLINDLLAHKLKGRDCMDIPGAYAEMLHAIRNLGRPGIVSMAISAVDIALWDLKAKLLDISLTSLLGRVRDGARVYGSGGFTTYTKEQLQEQLSCWVREGIPRVKMKIGTHPDQDLQRVGWAREAIGDSAELFVDANGGYSQTQAVAFAEKFAQDYGVVWFEEPRPSDDLEGLHFVREHATAGMDIAAGEYGYQPLYFRRMLDAGAVDVLQADASRCGGVTGFLTVSALCESHFLPFSAHCAPSLHVAAACASPPFRHMEYFHDHVRIEHMLFDGALTPVNGVLYPDLSRPGMGLEFKHADAEPYRVPA